MECLGGAVRRFVNSCAFLAPVGAQPGYGSFLSSMRTSARAPVASPGEVLILFIFWVKPNSNFYGSLTNLPPPSFSLSLQVPKVTLAHQALLALLGPQALQGPREAEDPKARGSQTCSTASAQVTSLAPGNLPLPLPVPTLPSSRLCARVL